MPQNAISEARSELSKAEADLRAAAAQSVNDQREAIGKQATDIRAAIHPAQQACNEISDLWKPEIVTSSAAESQQASAVSVDGDDWTRILRGTATELAGRMTLKDGDTGWPLSKIFQKQWLFGAESAEIEDGYLSKPHQLRNLRELLALLVESSKSLKTIHVRTRMPPLEDVERSNKIFDDLAKDLFRNHGVVLTKAEGTDSHDRFVYLDHGVVFKLGRGLDLYKPATGLAASRLEARKVRACEIDCFRVPARS